MERLQWFDRKNGTWTMRHRLLAGFEENWVLDKTTDSGRNFTIIIKEQREEPEVDVGDWARILYLDNPDDAVTYYEDGRPDNHTQYVVGAVKKVYNKALNQWRVSFEFTEPVEITRGIVGETLTYTNQRAKTVEVSDGVFKTYTKEPYNHLSALERWLKVTPANCDTYEPGYDPKKNVSWYNRIKIMDREWLEKLPFSDTTYNELSLYNVLMDNYDWSTGRTPVLYFDMDPATDLPRNLEREEYLLKFERQDGFDKPALDYDELTKKTDDIMVSKVMDNYATGLVANVDNMSTGEKVSFPAEGLYAVPEVDAEVRDTTKYNEVGSDYWIVRTPFPIKRIFKVKRLELNASRHIQEIGNETNELWSLYRGNSTVLNEYILEKQQYLATIFEDNNAQAEKYFWWEEGTNKLHIKEYRYIEDWEASTFIYYVEYEPLINCRLDMGDQGFVHQFNQSSAQIDSEKFGKFMEGYLDAMNKSDISFGKIYTHPKQFKDLIGSRVIRGEREYMITNISYRNRVFEYYVAFQLNENHVRKNANYQVSQAIRENVAIATEGIKERKTAIKQRIYLGWGNLPVDRNRFLVGGVLPALSAVLPGQVPSSKYPQVALIKTHSAMSDGSDFSRQFLVPIAKFIVGNEICLNIQFFDNAEAGKQKIVDTKSDVTGYRNNFTPFVQKQIPRLYTDPFGEIHNADISFHSISYANFSDIQFADKEGRAYQIEVDNTAKAYRSLANMPDVTLSIANSLDTPSFKMTYQNILKDQLEKFNETTCIEFLTDPRIILCREFYTGSRLFRKDDPATTLEAAFYATPQRESDVSTPLFSSEVTASVDPVTQASLYFVLKNKYPMEAESVIIYAGGWQSNHKLIIINRHFDKNANGTGFDFS